MHVHVLYLLCFMQNTSTIFWQMNEQLLFKLRLLLCLHTMSNLILAVKLL